MRTPSSLQVVLLLALSAFVMASGGLSFLSPGPLGDGHAQWASDCERCHLVFEGIPNGRCLDCHDGLNARITAKEGFHASVADQPCINCHTDHGGRQAPLTRADARKRFQHASTGFALVGAHGKAECADCHEKPIDEMVPSCLQCHEDHHQSALGPACEDCHTANGWDVGLKTLAEHNLSMTGGHQGQDCEDCHQHGENLYSPISCANCHDQGHGGTDALCENCHQVSGWKPAEFDHGPCTCAFPGAHQTVGCLSCHEGFGFTNTPTLCSGCHESERRHEPLGECSTCHNALSWSDNHFNHNAPSVRFPLNGEHLSVDCSGCHETEGVFTGAPATCAGCHQEIGDLMHGDFGACEQCHVTSGFENTTFDHDTTGFSLTGQHATLGCQDCHAEKVDGFPAPPSTDTDTRR